MTMVAPVGKSYINDMNTPKITEVIAKITDIKMVFLKLLEICKAVIVGNIIILDINMVPTTLIPRTTVIEVSTATK